MTRGAYILMEYLYRRLGKQEPRIIGIPGDPNTPASMERANGVKDYVAHARQADVHVGGMAGFRDASASVAKGGLAATSAGGYLIRAWAVVMLHD
jgi:ABC-type sugar transport system substrate-binding protein